MSIKKKTGWIVYNGYVKPKKFTELVEWIDRVAKEKGLDTKLVKHYELVACIENGKSVLKGKYKNERPDFIIFWDKDVRLARHLEKMGFRLYNNSSSIKACDDKTITYHLLADHGLNIPMTINSPLVFPRSEIEWDGFYEYVEESLGYPMIIKEAYGSFGYQVYLVNNREELWSKAKELEKVPHLYQEFISSSKGKDIRLNVVGDEVVATMMRKSDTDFRANVSSGGKMYRYEASEEEKEIAVKCAKLVGADFAGVDLLFGENGKMYVCEINSNAHMKNIYECTGVDVSEKIIEYIINDLETE